MVKGVSKTIIEVNNTGSKLFEKIVFYVTPEYGNLSAKQLKRAATEFSFNYDSAIHKNTALRKRCKRKRNIKLLAVCGAVLTLAAVILVLIL
ncbi:MAG: hypothetical protein U0K93_04920 [Acutalibacteraceae bacterium]|nr:hypothetical protein [Acutalibacteraceae bacterium]